MPMLEEVNKFNYILKFKIDLIIKIKVMSKDGIGINKQ